MADKTETPTLRDHFNEAIRIVEAGVKTLNATGVPTPQAAEIACKMLEHANEKHEVATRRAEWFRPDATYGQMQEAAPQRKYSKAEEKATLLDAIRRSIPQYGITREELLGLFGEQRTPNNGPAGGDDNNDTEVPVVAQNHGPKTETAEGRTDDTNPGGSADTGEPTTGEPPHVEPGTGPRAGHKPPKPAKPRH